MYQVIRQVNIIILIRIENKNSRHAALFKNIDHKVQCEMNC